MTDPLHVLRANDPPVQPDPEFAARLRQRLDSALSVPEGAIVSGIGGGHHDPRPAALPYLSVSDARAALAWYTAALDATVVGEPIVMSDGRIGHAEIAIGNGVLYLADEHPELGLKAPAPGAVSVSLMLQVFDTDAVLRRVRGQGADVERESYENYGSRNATIIDPFGHRWMLRGPIRATGIQHGDIGYVSVWAPDVARAAAFYGRLLGWSFDPQSHRVTNTELPTGISSGRPTLFCCYAVDDIDIARITIAEAGGVPGEIRHTDYGALLGASDPDGLEFAVFQPPPSGQKRPAINGSGPGELSYVTYNVPDSAAFRGFYGRVLGWTFEPGRISDGWEIQRSHPMSGAAGGSSHPMAVPMWTVADIEAAVQRVRAAGGTVISEPSRQSYGLSAECLDDQGGRFYLGEF